MANRKIYLLSVASTIVASLGTLLIASSLSSISAVDNYALIQTSAMFGAFWVATYIDYETAHIKSDNKIMRLSKIPYSYYLFALIGVASLYFMKSFNGEVLPIYIFYVLIYPLFFFKNEYSVVASMAENNLKNVYFSRIIKQIPPAMLALLTGSVAWTIVGALLGVLMSSLYLQICLKSKIKWIYVDVSSKNHDHKVMFKSYYIGLMIAAGLAAMWYFERLSLSLIEIGLVSIAFFSLQITNTIASLIAGTLAAIQFNNSHKSLGLLRRQWVGVFVINLFLMLLVYFLVKIFSAWLDGVWVSDELLTVIKNNTDFISIYSMAAVPVTTALFIGRMCVASGNFDSIIKFYMITVPIHFLIIALGLFYKSAELLAAHLMLGNLFFCILALRNRGALAI